MEHGRGSVRHRAMQPQPSFPGLQKIATGSDPDAKEWLRSILKEANDTPEKRSLLALLAKPL